MKKLLPMLLAGSLIVSAPLFSVTTASAADAPAFSVNGSNWLRENLQKAVNTRVTVRLIAGEEITGTVVAVGDEAVHISALSGRDFYDAVVSLEMISAVIVNVRGK